MRSGKYYKGIQIDGKKIDFHRYIMEQEIGRKLNPDEVVHHIDGDINNNNLSNLRLMTRSEHGRLHGVGKTMPLEERKRRSIANTGMSQYASRKLSDNEAVKVFEYRKQGYSFRKIGLLLGISHHCVQDIYNGKHYRNVNPNISKGA